METHEIPILFLQDDIVLLKMYREYLEAKGYDPIVIRGGKDALEYAIAETPSLLTLNAKRSSSPRTNRSPIFIFTQRSALDNKFTIKPAAITSEIFGELRGTV